MDGLLKVVGSQAEPDEESPVSSETEETLEKMRPRDALHQLNAAEQPNGSVDASSVADMIKKKSRVKYTEERKNRKCGKSPASTVSSKLDRLQLPVTSNACCDWSI